MAKQSYASEVGMNTGEKRVSLPTALIILFVLTAAGWFAFSKAKTAPHGSAPATEQVKTGESGSTH